MGVTKMICVSSTEPAWFTPGAVYDSEPRGTDIFLIGFQQAILFRGANQ